MRGEGYRRYGAVPVAGIAMALAASFAPSWAQDRGTCVTAEVPEAYVLPDGSAHPGGRLTLCVIQAFTPSLGLHRLDAGNDGWTMAVSRREVADEYTEERPQILFRRLPDGGLRLAGYVLPNGGKPLRYAFRVTAPWPSAEGDVAIARTSESSSEILRLAAVVR